MTEPAQSPIDVFVPGHQQPAAAPPAAAPHPPVRPKRTAVVVLAVIAGLLFCTTGALGVLCYIAVEASIGQASEIEARNREVGVLRAKAEASENEAVAARNERETMRFTAERAEKCRAAAAAYKEASFTDDQAKLQATWNQIYLNC